MNKASSVQEYTFDDMKKISRTQMGKTLPIELCSMVCDLEGAIMEGALNKIKGQRVHVRK